jgi:hypothetical protein
MDELLIALSPEAQHSLSPTSTKSPFQVSPAVLNLNTNRKNIKGRQYNTKKMGFYHKNSN